MTGPNTLLVEGVQDLHVTIQVCAAHGLLGGLHVHDGGGYPKLSSQLDVYLDAGGLQRLGIIVDADAAPNSRWDSVRDKLTACGYRNLPEKLPPGGLVLSEDTRPVVGVWLMPDCDCPGAVEDFFQSLVHQDDTLWVRAQAAVDSIPAAERLFTPAHATKAVTYTWLAWQSTPGMQMGLAIKAGKVDPHALPARSFVDWIRRLLETPLPAGAVVE